jgi:signal transduction histidine kinase/phage shock protein PspC (stress-responsive transcriptional regulator)
VIAGVAGGLAARLGVDSVLLRLAFVVLALAGGAGVVAYLAAFLVMGWPDRKGEPSEPPRTSVRKAVAVALSVSGVLLILRRAGMWLGDGIVWPAALVALGSAVVWTRGDEVDRARWLRWVPRADALEGSHARAAIGAVLALLGTLALLSENLDLLSYAPLAAATVLVGLGVLVGPWIWHLVRQVALERRERIRQEERAEMAAHLHDSVLQTLALIQRSDDPAAMVALARGQERELRTWLYGKGAPVPGSLSAALEQVAAEIERTHRSRVDLVLVGDCALDEGVRALVQACREAMVNAARHSGARGVSVYVEVEDEAVTAFVRDQGVGFARASVPPDRVGIVESIEGRMQRNGGVAVVESEPGRGTEVRLRVPRVRA